MEIFEFGFGSTNCSKFAKSLQLKRKIAIDKKSRGSLGHKEYRQLFVKAVALTPAAKKVNAAPGEEASV